MASDPKYSVFISHAGEEKSAFVDCVYQLLINRGGQLCEELAFMDEHSLKRGGPKPWETICKAAMNCDAAVVVLSPSYVRKKHPMAELEMLLGRPKDPAQFILLPVFFGLTVENCQDLEAWYSQTPWPTNLEEVDESTLKTWANLVKSLPKDHTGCRLEPGGFHGVLATNVVEEVVKRLVEVGKLPESLVTNQPAALKPDRMVLKLPSQHLVGRQEQILQAITGLCGRAGAVVIHGPPGEGKTTVAVHAALALCEKGWFPGGAFQVDLSGFTKASKVEDFFAARLCDALQKARGMTSRPSEPRWRLTADWLEHGANGHVLLVLDNAEDVLRYPDSAQKLRSLLEEEIQHFGVGTQRRVRLVVNSRSNPEMSLDGACQIDLGELPLPVPDALLLLNAHVGDEQWSRVTEAERNQLVAMCQGNPLSLKLTGGFINQRRCTAQEVLQQFRKWRSFSSIDNGRTQLVKSTLRANRVHISWLLSMLCQAEQHAVAQLSLFAGSFDASAAAAVTVGVQSQPQGQPADGTGMPPSCCSSVDAAVEKLLSELQRLSILQLSMGAEQGSTTSAVAVQSHTPPGHAGGKPPRYQMHLLVRELTAELRSVLYRRPLMWYLAWLVACLLLATAVGAAVSSLAAAPMALLAAWPSWKAWCWHKHHAAKLAERRMVWWMLQHPSGPGQQLVRLSKAGDVEACRRIVAEEASNFEAAVRLVDDVVRSFGEVHAQRVSEQLQQAGNAVFQAVARFLRDIPDGSIVTAQQAQEDAVQYCILVLGPEHVVTLGAQQRLAWLLFEDGKPMDARDMLEELVQLFTKVRGRRHTDTILCKAALAHVLECLGRFQQAKALFVEAVQYFASKPRNWAKLVTYYDSKYWAVSKKQRAQAKAELSCSLEAHDVLEDQIEQTDAPMQGDRQFHTGISADPAVATAEEDLDDNQMDIAQQQQPQQQQHEEVDPLAVETAARWATELLSRNHEKDMEFLRELQSKMGPRFPEAMFLPPVLVTDEEKQRMFRIMESCRRFWAGIAQLHRVGQITDSIFHHLPHWVARGKEYRELVEPVCIASWYYLNEHVAGSAGAGTALHYADGIEDLEAEVSKENGRRPVEFVLLQRLEKEVLAEQQMLSTVAKARWFRAVLGNSKWEEVLSAQQAVQADQAEVVASGLHQVGLSAMPLEPEGLGVELGRGAAISPSVVHVTAMELVETIVQLHDTCALAYCKQQSQRLVNRVATLGPLLSPLFEAVNVVEDPAPILQPLLDVLQVLQDLRELLLKFHKATRLLALLKTQSYKNKIDELSQKLTECTNRLSEAPQLLLLRRLHRLRSDMQ